MRGKKGTKIWINFNSKDLFNKFLEIKQELGAMTYKEVIVKLMDFYLKHKELEEKNA